MARKKKTTAEQVIEYEKDDGSTGTATIGEAPPAMEPTSEQAETGEQVEMFPELDLSKPEEKEAYNAARAYRKAKGERDELLTDAKAKVDGCRERLITAMGVLGRSKFHFDGIKCEIIAAKAKVRVIEDNDDDDNDGDDE